MVLKSNLLVAAPLGTRSSLPEEQLKRVKHGQMKLEEQAVLMNLGLEWSESKDWWALKPRLDEIRRQEGG